MHKILKLFPSLILIIITVLTSILFDMQQKSHYQNIVNDKYYPYSEDILLPNDITIAQHQKIIQLAKRDQVNLVYSDYDTNKRCLTFYSSDKPVKLLDYFNLKKGNKHDDIISSIDHSHAYYINDFFNNDRVMYYPIKYIYQHKQVPLGGNIEVKYQDAANYKHFIDQLAKYLNISKHDLHTDVYYIKPHSEIVILGIGVVIILFSTFYLMLSMYYVLKNSYKISCFKLQGFSNIDILSLLFDSKIILLISILIILLSLLLHNLYFTLIILLIAVILIVLTKSLQCLALKLIVSRNWNDLLKKVKCGNKLFSVIMINKILIGIVLLFLICFNLDSLFQSQQITNNLVHNKGLNYGMITNINIDANVKEQDFINFYRDITHTKLKYIYADFYSYSDESYKTYEPSYLNKLWKNNFLYARVDNNYLKTEKIKIIDQNNQKVNIQSLNDCYIYPKSKQKYLTNFKKYNTMHKPIYFYDGHAVNTYLIEQQPKQISNAILYVIDKNNPHTYNETPHGLDIAGTGFSTDLKFLISGNDQKTYQKLVPYLRKNHLLTAINQDCFKSGKSYKENIINRQKVVYINLFLMVIPLSLLYFFAMLLSFILYIDLYAKDIHVKALLGFEKKDMFKKVLLLNCLSELSILMIGILYYGIIQHHLLNCAITIIMILIDNLIIAIIMKKCKVRK